MNESEVVMIRASRPKKCPKCKHSPMQLCVIGMPREEDYFTDKYYFLGCIPNPSGNPKWHCSACDLFIYKKSDLKTSNPARFTDVNIGYQLDPNDTRTEAEIDEEWRKKGNTVTHHDSKPAENS